MLRRYICRFALSPILLLAVACPSGRRCSTRNAVYGNPVPRVQIPPLPRGEKCPKRLRLRAFLGVAGTQNRAAVLRIPRGVVVWCWCVPQALALEGIFGRCWYAKSRSGFANTARCCVNPLGSPQWYTPEVMDKWNEELMICGVRIRICGCMPGINAFRPIGFRW